MAKQAGDVAGWSLSKKPWVEEIAGMVRGHAILAAMGVIYLCSVSTYASTCVYFDVANAGNGLTSLAPKYTASAELFVTATSLTAHRISPSHDSDLESLGDFLFTDWANAGYFECSVTARQPVRLTNFKYSFFSGLWSNMGSCRGVWFLAQSSTDNFATNKILNTHGLIQTVPYISDCPNDFNEDLNALGVLAVGQTISFIFYGMGADYPHIAAGFWNKSPNDYNPTIELVAVPEPASLMFLILGGIAVVRRR